MNSIKFFRNIFAKALFIKAMLLGSLLLLCANSWSSGEHEETETPEAKGQHNGRVLEDGDFKLELAIFEKGVPPEFHTWAYDDDKLLNPKDWKVTVQLTRLGEKPESLTFVAQQDFYRSQQSVAEPHSFDVKVIATQGNKTHQWEFSSYEGRVNLTPAMAKEVGITTATAEAGIIQQQIPLYGRVVARADAQRQIRARFPGLVKSVAVSVGQKVTAGETLATVEGNDSLRTYAIVAPIAGTITAQTINAGEITGDEPLFSIQNLDALQVELSVFPQQARSISNGQTLLLDDPFQKDIVQTHIDSLVPATATTPVSIARAKLDNANHQWMLNSVIKANAITQESLVKLRVDNRALQTFRDWQVVFIKVGDAYEIRPVTLGAKDNHYSEVLEGLEPGATYVVENSYLLKADIEKSGASHDH